MCEEVRLWIVEPHFQVIRMQKRFLSRLSTPWLSGELEPTFPSVPLIGDPGIGLNSLQIASLTLTWSKLRQPSLFFFNSAPPPHLYSHKAPSLVVRAGKREKWRGVLFISKLKQRGQVLLRISGGSLLPPAGWEWIFGQKRKGNQTTSPVAEQSSF